MRSRILFLILSGCLLLAVFMSQAQSSSSLLASTPIEPLTIVIASDPHYLAPELTGHGPYFQRVVEAADGKVTEYCEELLNAFTDEIIVQAPDILILTGDLSFNGERQSHERLSEKLRLLAVDVNTEAAPGAVTEETLA